MTKGKNIDQNPQFTPMVKYTYFYSNDSSNYCMYLSHFVRKGSIKPGANSDRYMYFFCICW